jgi:hypothetical protein
MGVLRAIGNVVHLPPLERSTAAGQALARGDYAEARAQYERAVSHWRTLRLRIGAADSLMDVASVALRQSDPGGALTAVREAVAIYASVGNRDRQAQCASFAAAVAALHDEWEHAATLLGAADALWRPYWTNAWHRRMEDEYHRLLPLTRAQLSSAEFDAAWEAGQQMTVRQVTADILTM